MARLDLREWEGGEFLREWDDLEEYTDPVGDPRLLERVGEAALDDRDEVAGEPGTLRR